MFFQKKKGKKAIDWGKSNDFSSLISITDSFISCNKQIVWFSSSSAVNPSFAWHAFLLVRMVCTTVPQTPSFYLKILTLRSSWVPGRTVNSLPQIGNESVTLTSIVVLCNSGFVTFSWPALCLEYLQGKIQSTVFCCWWSANVWEWFSWLHT